MFERVIRILLGIALTAAVIVSGYLAYTRHVSESSSKTVELVMDLRDIQMLSALSKYPVDKLLNDLKKLGIASIGLSEEKLSDANVLGEVYYASGAGILKSGYLHNAIANKPIKPDNSYLICFNPEAGKRIERNLLIALPKKGIKKLSDNVIEINSTDVYLGDLGVGFSEVVESHLTRKGFRIIPRIKNDIRCDVGKNVNEFKNHDTVIFDGDEILGYPEKISVLAQALKQNKIKYGNVEIIKQDGDSQLKKLMGVEIVRVHSVPKDELLKINKDEALIRFNRAIKERSIRLIYVRPFLPPQITEDPVKYNLQYLKELKTLIEKGGYSFGKASAPAIVSSTPWQTTLMGMGVLVFIILLVEAFIPLPWYVVLACLAASPVMIIFAGTNNFLLEKVLAFLAAVVVPSYAVISQYNKKQLYLPSSNIIFNSIYIMVNVISECAIGVFLIIGLLANTSFMLGAQGFIGIKIALVLPVLVIVLYFIPRSKEKIMGLLNQKVPVYSIFLGVLLLAGFGILLARSGNFTLPVPQFEKIFRSFLEVVLGIRPRTKEFLIGYPFLIMAGIMLLKGKKDWLWLFLAVGVIGPISLINSFTHIHTPILISIIRSINGLVLGVVVGAAVSMGLVKILNNKRNS
ncbi:MAG: hypothetical protein FD145_847 [Candidatus Saganbacteria bacterium]|uniref:Uncharacterized protein n=1 Tax=Candidatus Saganbacteria bacterium TaxID=2575572 RepID=A0A833L118_UNCSA|nr:MAG: hypothetical protein FD145_847 [Candidatus Saganbacteria bacterium]